MRAEQESACGGVRADAVSLAGYLWCAADLFSMVFLSWLALCGVARSLTVWCGRMRPSGVGQSADREYSGGLVDAPPVPPDVSLAPDFADIGDADDVARSAARPRASTRPRVVLLTRCGCSHATLRRPSSAVGLVLQDCRSELEEEVAIDVLFREVCSTQRQSLLVCTEVTGRRARWPARPRGRRSPRAHTLVADHAELDIWTAIRRAESTAADHAVLDRWVRIAQAEAWAAREAFATQAPGAAVRGGCDFGCASLATERVLSALGVPLAVAQVGAGGACEASINPEPGQRPEEGAAFGVATSHPNAAHGVTSSHPVRLSAPGVTSSHPVGAPRVTSSHPSDNPEPGQRPEAGGVFGVTTSHPSAAHGVTSRHPVRLSAPGVTSSHPEGAPGVTSSHPSDYRKSRGVRGNSQPSRAPLRTRANVQPTRRCTWGNDQPSQCSGA